MPLLVLPLLLTAGYFGFRWVKARKNKPVVEDVEKGDFVLSSTSSRKGVEDESVGPQQYVMTPALISNSVHVPVAFSRNF